ncbi:MAG TPA: nodulation protein NfeD [Ardenticatenaceae bacterium]
MWRWMLAIGLVVTALGIHLGASPAAAQGGQEVVVLTVEGPVTPAMGSYLERGLEAAEESGADLLVLRLDTPGGNVEVMRQLVGQLSNATVPTLVYVWPSGGRAASAGTFITLSADLAAMAPQTTIGAASVVGGSGEEIDETLSAKITNDLVAAIRSQTERRGPEASEWAERAITEAIAANTNEALELGIIDLVARDLDELLAQADGRTVELASGEVVTLDVGEAAVREIEMSPFEELLHILTDPNIALMLLSLGGLALVYELMSPGGYIGGIFGFIATALGLYSLGALNADWTGLALMAFAFVLFVVEIKAATHGLFAAGGVAAFVFGALLLFQTSYARASLWLVLALAVGIGAYFLISVAAVLRTRHQPAITGREGLVGSVGEVRTSLEPGGPEGLILVAGELWKARSPVPLAKGCHVRVVAVRGLHLDVVPETESSDMLLVAEP